MNYYLEALKKYAVFEGRARRKEYWMFLLFSVLIEVALEIVGEILGFSGGSRRSVISSLYSLAVLIPSIAVAVRRMHDVDKSGWYILIPIYNLVLILTDGTFGDNQYGPDPKNRTFDIENPSTTWKCPKCDHVNTNTSKVCVFCSYSLK